MLCTTKKNTDKFFLRYYYSLKNINKTQPTLSTNLPILYLQQSIKNTIKISPNKKQKKKKFLGLPEIWEVKMGSQAKKGWEPLLNNWYFYFSNLYLHVLLQNADECLCLPTWWLFFPTVFQYKPKCSPTLLILLSWQSEMFTSNTFCSHHSQLALN